MFVYSFQSKPQEIKSTARKEREIKPLVTKIPILVWIALLAVTFGFAQQFTIKIYLNTAIVTGLFSQFDISYDILSMSITVMLSLISTGLLYLYIMVYNILCQRYTNFTLPYTKKELMHNLFPFFVVRNIIWALLSTTMFWEGGYFVALGNMFYEMFATMIIFLPAFFHMKKHYIKDGYGASILLNMAVPYLIIQIVPLGMSIIF